MPERVGAGDVEIVLVHLEEDTGLPFAAHTPLKLTPAAITSTSTSPGPGSGTSTVSSCIASIGSPIRSGRITQARMAAGTASPVGSSTTRNAGVFIATAYGTGWRRGTATGHRAPPPGWQNATQAPTLCMVERPTNAPVDGWIT